MIENFDNPLSRALTAIEGSPVQNPNLDKVIRLASLDRKFWQAKEMVDPKAWPVQHTKYKAHETEFALTPDDATPIHTAIEHTHQAKGQAVLFLLGDNDNPFEDVQTIMEPSPSSGIHPLVVIHMGFSGHDAQTALQEGISHGNGRTFHIGGHIGTPEGLEAVKDMVELLHREGIIRDPSIDIAVTRLGMGLYTFPGEGTLGQISGDIVVESQLSTPGAVTPKEVQEARNLIQDLEQLSEQEREQLFQDYLLYIAQHLYPILSPDRHVVFGELPLSAINDAMRPYRPGWDVNGLADVRTGDASLIADTRRFIFRRGV